MSLRIGLLGAGNHSRDNHGPSLAQCASEADDVELVALCDLDADRATDYAACFGFACVYTDLQAMLAAEQLDGLVAVTPIVATEAVAAQVLQVGIPVAIEKPPGVDADATQRLLAVAQRTGTPHMLSFNRRFNPALRRALDWMEVTGAAPRLVHGRMLRHRRLEDDFALGTGIHLLDCVLSLVGTPDRVEARVDTGARALAYSGWLLSESGPPASIHIAPDAGCAHETVELLCDDARIRLDFQHTAVRIEADGECVLQWRAADDGLPLYEENGTLDETRAFLDALRQGHNLAPALTDGLVSMRVAEAFQQGKSINDMAKVLP